MNIKSLLTFKKLEIPETNDTKEVDAVQLWSVRWYSRHGQFSGDVKAECEFFTEEDKAKDFYIALQNAFKLIKHTSGTNVIFAKES